MGRVWAGGSPPRYCEGLRLKTEDANVPSQRSIWIWMVISGDDTQTRTDCKVHQKQSLGVTYWLDMNKSEFSSPTSLEKLIHSLSFPLFHYTIYFLSFTQPVELEKRSCCLIWTSRVVLLEVEVDTPPRWKLSERFSCDWVQLPGRGGGGYKFNHSRWMLSLREMEWLIIFQGSFHHIHLFDFCCQSYHLGRDYIIKQLNSDNTSPSHM